MPLYKASVNWGGYLGTRLWAIVLQILREPCYAFTLLVAKKSTEKSTPEAQLEAKGGKGEDSVGRLWAFWEGWLCVCYRSSCCQGGALRKRPSVSSETLYTLLGLQQSMCVQCVGRNYANWNKDGDISLC